MPNPDPIAKERTRTASSPTPALIPVAVAALALLASACTGESAPQTRIVEARTPSGTSLGSVAMAGSCGEAADELLAPALALLHNMTFTEAEALFREATETEPECALAHWGVAMSFVHPLWPDVVSDERLREGREWLDRAREASLRTPRDDAFIAALGGYYESGEERSEAERLAAFHRGWERAHETFPDDPEVTAFYALSMLATAATDPAYPDQKRAGELLQGVLARVDDHPGGLHYTIHAYDFPPLAERALPTARRYGEVAPDNAHALHMTSHIFTRLGLWEDSIAFNRRSADAAAERPIDGKASHHLLHALDYLAYAHLQRGDDEAADAVAAELRGLGPMHDHAATAYAVAAIPARLALERDDWEAAAGLQEPTGDEVAWEKYPHLAAIPVFARALGAARSGDPDRARAALDRLAELRNAAAELPGSYDWATQVEIQRLSADAWLRLAEGDEEAALATAREAADLEATTDKNPVTPGAALPARELYADMLLELGHPAEALTQYERSMERTPNRFRALAGAAEAARRAGRDEEAAAWETRLLEIAGDSSRNLVRRLRDDG